MRYYDLYIGIDWELGEIFPSYLNVGTKAFDLKSSVAT